MIVEATKENIREWLFLRERLYTGLDRAFHEAEIEIFLKDATRNCFIAFDGETASGFVEVTLRNIVDGCLSSPVGYIEGGYVIPEARGKGLSRELHRHAEAWFRQRACTEIATDAELDNTDAIAFHRAMGFEETYRIVEFRKKL